MREEIRLEQLVLGPRAAGRDFGVVAATPGLTLSDEALSATLDYNLALGDHIQGHGPIQAFFPISTRPGRPLWFLSSTTDLGRISGNPVWMTWGQIIDSGHLAAMGGRADRLLQFHERRDLPPAGTSLAPLVLDVARLAEEHGAPAPAASAMWRLQPDLGRKPLVVEVEAPMDPTATLIRILDKALAETRTEISFVTAPVPLFHWDLICFAKEEWSQKAWRPSGAKLHCVSGAGEIRGDGADLADVLWWTLRATLAGAADEESPALRKALAAGRPSADPGEPAEQRVAGGLRSILSEIRDHLGEPAVRSAMAGLMRAVAEVGEDEPRSLLSAALRRVYGSMTQARPADPAWLELYFRQPEPVTERLAWPPLMLARLAASGRAAVALDPEILGRVAPEMVSTFPAPLLKQAQAAPSGLLESEAELLAQTLEYLEASNTSGAIEPTWELAFTFHCRVVQAAVKDRLEALESRSREKARAGLTKFLLKLHALINTTQLDRFLRTETSVKAASMIGEPDWRRIVQSREHAAVRALALENVAQPDASSPDSQWPFAFRTLCARRDAA
ncbi:MAG: hypothetical protein JOZ90_16220 [Alphaproteobacteria bacterium]|nr:hypothetical protein [Alphaproteobacteria bacterium]MBV9371997.1 hypothetical protein [Alphaproteobacteria bacterium]MBV9902618.1 hypothetical protein [Alphaproteobacteria bacterium]